MNNVLISEFEKNCHWFLEQVEQTGLPLVLIKNGQPCTQILPYKMPKKSLLGLYENQIEIKGDIISPIDVEWEALKFKKHNFSNLNFSNL